MKNILKRFKPFLLLEVKADEKTYYMTTNDNITSKLEQISKENPFKTPDNYFDNFAVRMAEKISQNEAAKVRRPLFEWARPQMAFALALAGFAILVVFGIRFYQNNNKPISSQELAEAMEYSIVSEMDENEIINQLDAANNQHALSKDSVTKIKEGNSKLLIDYLSKEDIDVNTIIDAL